MYLNVLNAVRVKATREINLVAVQSDFIQSIDKKEIARYTHRIAKKENPFLWEENPGIEEDILYLPCWEEELSDIRYDKQYTVKIDGDKYYRIGKAMLIRDMVRYFRSLGFPVRKDYIGRIEVWVPTPTEQSIGYDKYTLNPKYKDFLSAIFPVRACLSPTEKFYALFAATRSATRQNGAEIPGTIGTR